MGTSGRLHDSDAVPGLAGLEPLAMAEAPRVMRQYGLLLALLEARRAERLAADPRRPWRVQQWDIYIAQIERLKRSLEAALHLATTQSLDGLQFSPWTEDGGQWLPTEDALFAAIFASHAGLRLKLDQYQMMLAKTGNHVELAAAFMGVLTAGEFLGIAQFVETVEGREWITGRELSTGERLLGGAVGVLGVGSLMLPGYASNVRLVPSMAIPSPKPSSES